MRAQGARVRGGVGDRTGAKQPAMPASECSVGPPKAIPSHPAQWEGSLRTWSGITAGESDMLTSLPITTG